MEQEHLAQSIRHIARAEEMVCKQRDLIARLAGDGHDTGMAENLLATMLTTLDRMRDHRRLIEAAIAAGGPGTS